MEMGEATHGYTSFLQQGAAVESKYSLSGRNTARSEVGSTGQSRRDYPVHTIPGVLK